MWNNDNKKADERIVAGLFHKIISTPRRNTIEAVGVVAETILSHMGSNEGLPKIQPKNRTTKWFTHFGNSSPSLAPPLVGMCIIPTGFNLNITDEWSNPVSTAHDQPSSGDELEPEAGNHKSRALGCWPLGKKTEVHWVAPRAVPVSWCGHIWSHMVTFTVTGCMVDDHSSSLLSGGFTHFDLAFIVRLRGRSGHHGTSTNESVATFATTEVWLESSTFNQALQDLASDVSGCSGSPIRSILWSSIGISYPGNFKNKNPKTGDDSSRCTSSAWGCDAAEVDLRRFVEMWSIGTTCQSVKHVKQISVVKRDDNNDALYITPPITWY